MGNRMEKELRRIFGDDYDSISLDSPSLDGTQPTPSNPNESFENEEENDDQVTNLLDDDELEGEGGPSNDVEEPQSGQGSLPEDVEDESNEVLPGMYFDTLDMLFNAYQEHARVRGFSVVKRSTNKASQSEDVKYALITCAKSGISIANKYSKRVGCKAKLNAKKLEGGSWIVTKISSDHNHEIDTAFSPLMPAHRHLTVNMKRQLEANDIAGIRPCKNVRLCEVQCGGPQNLGCLPKDCRNFVEERRRLRLGDGDAEAIHKLFNRLQLIDRSFFYSMDLDQEGRLRNVLWIHPRCRAAYEEFNDVVSFDTTYLVNRYRMPFASIVGVNHHGHSILLGCALVTHEDAASFKWLFSNWLQAMGDIHPHAIITDQCESIKIAIRELMPDTIHRYCIWHILSKLQQKFKGVRELRECVSDFKGLVYDSLTIQTFEAKWREFVGQYHLQNNKWLKDLYDERDKWVPVYLHHTFWAGMISTQRSERMHAYFDEFVHSRSTLKQFMEQYDMAIGNKIQKEYEADFKSKNKVLKCISTFGWEMQFQEVYTHSIFKKIQDQIKRMMYCDVVNRDDDETVDLASSEVGVESIKVLETSILNNYYQREFTYTVEWRPIGSYINCNCKLFEFKGIFCCHIMKVLAIKKIQSVHERYVLQRWRKDVHRRHSTIFFVGSYPHMTDEYKKFQEVEKCFQQCTDAAMGSTEKLNFIKDICIELKDIITNWNVTTNNDVLASQGTQSSEPRTPILNPRIVTIRGRPRIYANGRGRTRGTRRTPQARNGTPQAQNGTPQPRNGTAHDRTGTTRVRNSSRRARGASTTNRQRRVRGRLKLVDEDVSEGSFMF